jgi:hypothetical protein
MTASADPPGQAEAVFLWILIAGKVLFWVARALSPSDCQRGRTADGPRGRFIWGHLGVSNV